MNSTDLQRENRFALITGSTAGIGLAVAWIPVDEGGVARSRF